MASRSSFFIARLSSCAHRATIAAALRGTCQQPEGGEHGARLLRPRHPPVDAARALRRHRGLLSPRPGVAAVVPRRCARHRHLRARLRPRHPGRGALRADPGARGAVRPVHGCGAAHPRRRRRLRSTHRARRTLRRSADQAALGRDHGLLPRPLRQRTHAPATPRLALSVSARSVRSCRGRRPPMLTITPFLWFDDQAEEAANFYAGVFPNSKITSVSRYTEAGPGKPGQAMTVQLELDGLAVTFLNGGPVYRLTEAFSFSVSCESQAEVDRYWAALSAGGEESQCGWLKDRYGLSWQIVPRALLEIIGQPDRAKAARAMQAMFQMKKLDVAKLRAAAEAG